MKRYLIFLVPMLALATIAQSPTEKVFTPEVQKRSEEACKASAALAEDVQKLHPALPGLEVRSEPSGAYFQ